MLKFTHFTRTAAQFKGALFSLETADDWQSIGDGPTRDAVLAWLEAGNTPEPADIPPPPTAIEQIRTIESKQEVADAMARASRQFLLGTWFARVKAKPGAAGLSDDQIEAYCRTNDKTYKTLAETDDAIKRLRAKV